MNFDQKGNSYRKVVKIMWNGYTSQYKKLSIPDRDIYKRVARLRYNAKVNCLSVHKLSKKNQYSLYNDSGYHKVCTLDEAEKLLKDLKASYFAAKLGVNKNANKSKSQAGENQTCLRIRKHRRILQ